MNKVALTFITIILMISCVNNNCCKVDFLIINKSSFIIDSIKITNWSSSILTEKFKIEDSLMLSIDFKNTNLKGDGSYAISYYLNEKEHLYNFGYFSNGIPTGVNYEIKIFNDTILIKEQIRE